MAKCLIGNLVILIPVLTIAETLALIQKMQNTEKKNQHYIPKFYLRNFSYLNNQKQIGVYNTKNCKYIPTAKLKTQGSKKFFYGKDGVLEDHLSDLEGFLATSINTIVSSSKLPKKDNQNYAFLLGFISITDLRSPVFLNMMKQMSNSMNFELNKLDPNFKEYSDISKLNDETLIKMLLSMSSEVSNIISDLQAKLLINQTNTAFISSDFPIIKYNQLLEKKDSSSKTGYGVVGLQIIFPINDKLSVILFDNSVYKVGNKRDNHLIIKKEKDIDSLNLLQFVNCLTTIFFNEKTSEDYIIKLHQKSKKFKKANQGKSELGYVVKNGENPQEIMKRKENLIIMNSTDCEINLSIEKIKIHSKGKSMNTINSNQLRKHPANLRKSKKN